MHRQAPHVRAAEQVVAKLLLAGGAPPGERDRPRKRARLAEAAPREEAPHPAEAEPDGNRESRHVGGLPEREPVTPEEKPCGPRRADEASVIGEAARPEFRPCEAVGLRGMAGALRGIPYSSVGRGHAFGLRKRPR